MSTVRTTHRRILVFIAAYHVAFFVALIASIEITFQPRGEGILLYYVVPPVTLLLAWINYALLALASVRERWSQHTTRIIVRIIATSLPVAALLLLAENGGVFENDPFIFGGIMIVGDLDGTFVGVHLVALLIGLLVAGDFKRDVMPAADLTLANPVAETRTE